ncbi:MAG: ATP-dependent sacrificial sulfur transferase LarE [Lachnospiraceae bacterium]|nr:ATP-dependent sacrificial sulfur transferase LarE [Lachnospiraceae bacterium]
MDLKEFFEKYPEVAIAFSGGVDSSYLLYAAKQYAKRCTAYYVKSDFQPEFEYRDAKKLAEELKADMCVINVDVLDSEDVRRNPENRCYYCKQLIFSTIKEKAASDGYTVLLDGTNASDDVNDRPGMKALQELEVKSPLRECGLTKDVVRKLSKEAGLFTWDKPAYACLATRIPANEPIDRKKLERIEKAEDYLFSMGFTDFRVRTVNEHARLEVTENQWMKVAEKKEEIYNGLKGMFKTVSLSLSTRK